MPNKKNKTEERLQKTKSENAVVYKVLAALLLLGATLMGLRHLRSFYASLGGFDLLYPLTNGIALGGLILFVLAALLTALVKNKIVRTIAPWFMVIGVMIGATGLSMHLSWTDGFPTLYFLASAFLLQYIIFQLYRWEFFLFSLSTVCSGFLFYHFSAGFSWTPLNILMLVVALLVVVLTALLARAASHNEGMMVFGHKRIQLLSAKSNPILIYLVDALWLVCIVATLVLGGLFAYYCMFAAIAVEFIAAVYYTFQLN